MYREPRRLRLVLAVLILTSFTLITLDYRTGDDGPLAALRGGAAAVLGPVQRAVSSAVRPVGNALSALGDLGSAREDLSRVQRENDELRGRLREGEDGQRRLSDMERMLALAGRGGYRTVPARVVAIGPSNFEWTATIDVGTRDGVERDMAVLNGDGLVGRVVSAGPFTAQVLLTIDAQFTAGARLASSGEVGSVTGNGLQPMRLVLLNPEAQVEVGRPVVSLGSPGGRPFVAGVPIGVVVRTVARQRSLVRTVEVRPYPSFTSLDAVGVVVAAPRVDPRDAVLPTPPPPTAPPG